MRAGPEAERVEVDVHAARSRAVTGGAEGPEGRGRGAVVLSVVAFALAVALAVVLVVLLPQWRAKNNDDSADATKSAAAAKEATNVVHEEPLQFSSLAQSCVPPDLKPFRHTPESVARWRTTAQAQGQGREPPPPPGSIFVSVASYRDDECKDTVTELFDLAQFPEKVFVGVVQQNKPGKGKEDCFDRCRKCRQRKASGHIRVLGFSNKEARGPCFARYLASTLWRGEDWYLQIDSHTAFEKDWDVHLLNELLRARDPKAVLSGYPPTGAQMDKIRAEGFRETTLLCAGDFSKDGLPQIKSAIVKAPRDGEPLPIPFASAGMICFPGRALFEVPFDPYLPFLFFGEEILFSARLWTRGYNFYAPSRAFCSHHYERKGKPKFWTDLKNFESCRKQAVARVKYLLGTPDALGADGLPDLQKVPPEYRTRIDEYGMGTERALADFWKYAGVDFGTETVEPRCTPDGYMRLASG